MSLENKQAKSRKGMTEAQRKARLANLAAGRQKRLESIKQKQEEADYRSKQESYDLSSEDSFEDSESDTDDDAFIISRKKKKEPPKRKDRKTKDLIQKKDLKQKRDDSLKHEVDELKNMVVTLANLQKKQARRKSTPRKSGGTKIVVLPPNGAPSVSGTKPTGTDGVIEALRKSLMQ